MKWIFKLSNVVLIFGVVISCNPKDPEPPIVDFTFDLTNDGVVIFTNTSTNASSYQWAFGDSTSSTESSPTHGYSTNGNFEAQLTASGKGGTQTTTKIVTVTNKMNKNGCLPVPVPACTPTAQPTIDPVAANNLLVGTWNWQGAYLQYSYYTDTFWTYPYPDGCNATLVFKTDQTFEFTVGANPKTTGNYIVDQQDITLSDQAALSFGGPNYVHEIKMHLTLQPDPLILNQSPLSPNFWFPYMMAVSGLLTIASDGSCLELWHWSRDIHGFTTTYGHKFVKGN